jgi:hypothetical protein
MSSCTVARTSLPHRRDQLHWSTDRVSDRSIATMQLIATDDGQLTIIVSIYIYILSLLHRNQLHHYY